jgi:hypothetical protein
MVTVKYKFAVGNCMIQYAAAYVLSLKYGLKFAAAGKSKIRTTDINNLYIDWENYFQIEPPTGGQIFKDTLTIREKEYWEYFYGKKEITTNLELWDYFQKKEIVYDYRKEILNLFTKNLKYEIRDEKEVFVHFRLGDILQTRSLVPKEYYHEALAKIEPSGGFIASDTIDHPWVNELASKYNLKKFICEPAHNVLDIINFAKNFNNLVVGEGTFGWWMAFLSRGNNIYCNNRPWKPGGNTLWNFPEWRYLSWDWDPCCIDPLNSKNILSYVPKKLS